MTAAQKIKDLREKKKLSQKQAASELGIHINTYSKMERGLSAPSKATAEKLAKYYGKDVSYFIDEKKPAATKKPAKTAKSSKVAAKEVKEAMPTAKEEPVVADDFMNPPVEAAKVSEKVVEKKAVEKKAPAKATKRTAKKPVKSTKQPAKTAGKQKTEATAAKTAPVSVLNVELQFAGKSIAYQEIIDRAKAIAGNKNDINIYIKTEESRVYYVAGAKVGSFEI